VWFLRTTTRLMRCSSRLNAVQQKNLLNHLDGAGERRRRLVERDFAERKTSNCNRTR